MSFDLPKRNGFVEAPPRQVVAYLPEIWVFFFFFLQSRVYEKVCFASLRDVLADASFLAGNLQSK